MSVKTLVGSGDRIALLTLPIAFVGVALNAAQPAMFSIGGPPGWLRVTSIGVLAFGLVIWIWSVILILTNVPRGRLITGGPYGWVKHPLYTAVALLVIPWVGFLLDTWLGVVIGVSLYVASRRYAPAEEAALSQTFGQRWLDYSHQVRLAWL